MFNFYNKFEPMQTNEEQNSFVWFNQIDISKEFLFKNF